MILGRVIGQVWATRRDERLGRAKLLVIRPHGWYQPAFDSRHLIATDDLDAGVGDDVVVCLGQPARRSLGQTGGSDGAGDGWPVDAAVMGVVDRIELHDGASRPAGAAPGIHRPLMLAQPPRAAR